MMFNALLIGIALFSACESRPGVHRFTGEYVTRVHKFREGGPGNGRGEGNGIDVNVTPAPGINVGVHGSKNLDGSFVDSDTDVNRRKRCNRGVVDQTANAIKSGVEAGVSKIEGAIRGLTGNGTVMGPVGGAVNAVGQGAGEVVNNAFEGVDYAIQDAACGLGNIANDAAYILNTGDVLGGVGRAGEEFFGGLGNMAKDLASEAASGVGGAAHQIFGFLKGLGK